MIKPNLIFANLRHPLKEGTSGDTMGEIPPSYNPKNPYNTVIGTDSGLQIELDDTPGAERICVTHRTGSHIEMQPDGTVKYKATKARQDVTIGPHDIMVNGDYKVTSVGGKCTVYAAGGELILQSDAGISIATTGQMRLEADDVYIKARGTGKITLDSIFVDVGPWLSLPGGITPTIGGALVPRIVAGGFASQRINNAGLKEAEDAASGSLTPGNFIKAIRGLVKVVSQITTQMTMIAPYATGIAAGVTLAKTLLSSKGKKIIPEIDQPEEIPLTSPRTYMGTSIDRIAFRDRQFDTPDDVSDSTTYTAHLNVCEQLGDFVEYQKDLPGQVFAVDETPPATEPRPYWSFPVTAGTVSCTSGDDIIIGTDTTFVDELRVGEILQLDGQTVEIAAIPDNTTLVLTAPWLGPTLSNISLRVYRLRSFEEYNGMYNYGPNAPLGSSGLVLRQLMENFVAPVIEKTSADIAPGLTSPTTAINRGGTGPGGGGGNIPPVYSGFIISPDEALTIIRRVFESQQWAVDSTTTREQRNAYLESAVAVLHYGHPIFNPNRPDPQWCVKSAGMGRPQSDDVIARQDSRDYWDIIVAAGGDAPYWSLGYGGVLGNEQDVYAPTQGSLSRIR